MKLLSLSLNHFKGARSVTLDTQGGQNATVYGRNFLGKTTLADAFYWGLFDKDSKGRSTFDIKTHENGVVIPRISHTVEMVFLMDDGSHLQLKKDYHEIWTDKRKSGTKEFDGHTTDYWVNTVPLSEKLYKARIEQICSEGLFRQLTEPSYFSSAMKWEARREALLKICGDVTDQDVISADSKLKDLPAILGKHTTEEYRKILAERKKLLKTQKEGIPARIDEVRRSTPAEASAPKVDLDGLRKEIQKLQEERAQANAGGAVATKRLEIQKLESEAAEGMRLLREDASSARNRVQSELFGKRDELNKAEGEVSRKVSQITDAKGLIEKVNAELESLRAAKAGIKERAFFWEEPKVGTCVTCGQALPLGDVDELRRSAEERFNLTKATDLEANIATGKAKVERRTTLEAGLAEAEKVLSELSAKLASLTEEVATLETRLANTTVAEVKETAHVIDLRKQVATLTREIEEIQNGQASALAQVDEKIAGRNQALKDAEAALYQIKARETALARETELGEEDKRLAGQIEQASREEYLIEEFIRAKVRMLTDRINSRFKLCQWKLFDEQINGGLKECCEATLNGTPYPAMSTSEQINVGLDIINTLADFYGFAPPIFIDNCESISHPIATKGQQIRLVVSDSDPTLRFEIEASTVQGALL